jgi:protein SCO1/2
VYPIRSAFVLAISLTVPLSGSLVLTGCRHARSDAGVTQAGAKRYPVQGKVMAINAASGEVELDAAAIPGFMDAMVMPFKLKDPAVLSELHSGDMLRGTLIVTDAGDLLDEVVITGESKPVAAPTSNLQPLEPGEAVPDFALVNQDGKTVHLSQYKGRVLLVTFVYTRCPLADYCPRMSRNFAAVDKALAADPDLYKKTHLLSISFDPKYDTPAVLRSYGGAYTGNYTKETFQHWEFAAPEQSDLAKVLNFFDVAATPENNNTVTHSLSTVAIGADGKVYKWYPDNSWTPAQLLADTKKALGQGA